jgi:hypothetical protein
MKTWAVYARVSGSKYIGTVEAETEEEALEKGWKHENCYSSVCHQCSDNIEDPEITDLAVEIDA